MCCRLSILFFLSLLFHLSCEKLPSSDSSEDKVVNSNPLIQSTSSYRLGKTEDYVIRFSEAMVSAEQVDSRLDDALWSITPRTEAELYWADDKTLILDPKDFWKSGERYTLDIRLSNLATAQEDVRDATLEFEVKPIRLELVAGQAYMDQDGQVRIDGYITSSDYLEPEDVEKFLRVNQAKNDDIRIEWETTGSLISNFHIANIVRSKDKSEVKLSWDGTEWDKKFKGQRRIQILGEGQFEVLSVRIPENSDRRILVQLSDPVSGDENLEGLFYIQGYNKKIKAVSRGSKIELTLEETMSKPFVLNVDPSIRSSKGVKLGKNYSFNLSFKPIKPQIRLVGNGAIVPTSNRVIFPFETANLRKVEVEIFEIFDDNVLQFLQYDGVSGSGRLREVGQIVHYEIVDLESNYSEDDLRLWQRHTLDLQTMIKANPGSIYQIRLGFRPQDMIDYGCADVLELDEKRYSASKREGQSIFDRYLDYGEDFRHRDNPCYQAYYYAGRYVKRNVLASNFGIIAKKGNESNMHVFLTDLVDLKPVDKAEVSVYNFQQQLIGTATTDLNGEATVALEDKAAFVVVRQGEQYGYLRVQNGLALDVSNFDVSGSRTVDGVDGYVYGERGVWRPGDTMHLFFVLEDPDRVLPASHPIRWTLRDARGKVYETFSSKKGLSGVYARKIWIDPGSTTGNWSMTVDVGNYSFQKTLKVETVKPNRLKIEMDLDEKVTFGESLEWELSSEWLHGASAQGLQATVDVSMRPTKTVFGSYSKYIFDDPSREYTSGNFRVLDAQLDEAGKAQVTLKRSDYFLPAGRLRMNLDSKVFEKSGNFSQDYFSIDLDPYSHYVGLQIPQRRWGRSYMPRGKESMIDLVSIDTDGKLASNRQLEVFIYRANWNWWYERGRNSLYRFRDGRGQSVLFTNKVKTNSQGAAQVAWKPDDYGVYFVKVCDTESGHCTGSLFYSGYGNRKSNQGGPRLIELTADKNEYQPGDNMVIDVPATADGKLLVAVEKGGELLQSFWVEANTNKNQINIRATKAMHPNAYIHIHQVQAHNEGTNELPMRMYGVINVTVKDGDKSLTPVLEAPKEIRPEEEYELVVSEKQGKAMTYTVAVVDEGLLDLTRFKTPDLYGHFHAKEALLMRTWDVYDEVLDGYGGVLDKFISVGGGGPLARPQQSKKANRFVPVVKVLGPFVLEGGQQAVHQLKMPNYMGRVRAMVVARDQDAYGSVDQSIQVKNPVMVLATAPRALSPGDKFDLGANVFALEDKIKKVKTTVQTNSLFSASTSEISQSFSRTGDQLIEFGMTTSTMEGIGTLELTSTGKGNQSREQIEIDVRNPLPMETEVEAVMLQAGEEWSTEIKYFGTPGTNSAALEISRMPALNLQERMSYLIRYPYGCVEQTTSKALAQLSLPALTELNSRQLSEIENNVNAAISRLQGFQLYNGGLSYWRGSNQSNSWGTSYAIFFLAQAQKQGYYVDPNFINRLVEFQKSASKSYGAAGQQVNIRNPSQLDQAYRLLSLCMIGSPEIGSMNRLRREDELDATAKLILAEAYAHIGQDQIATQLLVDKGSTTNNVEYYSFNFGSQLRNQGIAVRSYLSLGKGVEAAKIAMEMAEAVGSSKWHSTHSLAYALSSIAEYVRQNPTGTLSASWTQGKNPEEKISSDAAVWQRKLEAQNGELVTIRNTSETALMIRVLTQGRRPVTENLKSISNNILLQVNYKDAEGKAIDVKNLKQGDEFTAEVKVTNPNDSRRNYRNLALDQVFPSGWEIENDRLSGNSQNASSSFDHQDIRDDRVYTFFDLEQGKSKTFRVQLIASYSGDFFMPPTSVGEMYDNEVYARTGTGRVTIR